MNNTNVIIAFRLTLMQHSAGFRGVGVYEKVTQGVVRRHRVGFHAGDAGTRRPLPQPGDQTVNSILAPLGEHHDRPVGRVVDPSRQIQRPCHLAA